MLPVLSLLGDMYSVALWKFGLLKAAAWQTTVHLHHRHTGGEGGQEHWGLQTIFVDTPIGLEIVDITALDIQLLSTETTRLESKRNT